MAVQLAPVFADSKTFADATPRQGPASILRAYAAERPRGAQALKSFVERYFVLPEPAPADAPLPEGPGLRAHIDRLWDVLTRNSAHVPPFSSLLPLPDPYVVPGGRFREIYYWDSYFTMLGLSASGRRHLLRDMRDDFAYLIDTYGRIPNGTRTYYLSRSQPPFFFEMLALTEPADPADAYAHFLPQLRREYDFWMSGADGLRRGRARRRVVRMADGALLNRYWDDREEPRDESYREDVELAAAAGRPADQVYRDLRAAAESGWDFSSRWFADARTRASIRTTAIVPVDLNSLLFGLERAIESGCRRRLERGCAREFARRAWRRRHAMSRYLWDETAGYFRDYQWRERHAVGGLSAAALYPLYTRMASDAQAAALARRVRLDLLRAGGIVTTSVRTGEQWDAPNGWAPLQWIAVSGLRQYGQWPLAAAIACRWIDTVRSYYARTGKLVEKYDVVDPGRMGGGGEYPTQDGFGWTNGVTEELMILYPPARCGQS